MVEAVVRSTFERSACSAHPKSILQTIFCSQDVAQRKFAVTKILSIRDKEGARVSPIININANSLDDLIDKNGITLTEPLSFCY